LRFYALTFVGAFFIFREALMKTVDNQGRIVIPKHLGESEQFEPAPSAPEFSALSALVTLAKSTLGFKRQALKSS